MKHQLQSLASVQNNIRSLLEQYPLVLQVVRKIAAQQGRAILVGGAVRDSFLSLPIKDFDIEVHGLTMDQLEQILREFGPVSLIGKSFGVLRIHGLDIDWSLPRKDSAGRKPQVMINPMMSFVDAFRRRDLTVNAMGIDLNSFELIDPFHGIDDLQKGIARAPDITLFVEDPLRFYRVMQFVARFDLAPDAALDELCASMDVSAVSVERIDEEFKKLLLKSDKPSRGFWWLVKINRLTDLFPELHALIGVEQNPDWHPEGDVFEHTMQAIDAAAREQYDSDAQKLLIMYAVLCHDLGKAVTTKEDEEGILRSYGHSQAGVPIAKKLLHRITRHKELVEAVCRLVQSHLAPGELVKLNSTPAAYKRLANKLAPYATIKDLALVALADKRGRNAVKGQPFTQPFEDLDEFMIRAEKAGVFTHVEVPVLQGRDVMDVVSPGPEMGKLLKRAYAIQIEQGIVDKDELKRLALVSESTEEE